MGLGEREACGRCSMSTVVDATETDDEAGRDPFGDERIELDDADLRRASPSAWLGSVVSKLDDVATSITYGKR